MNKEWIMSNWESDWDDENIYFKVTKDGEIIKYDIRTDTLYKYNINRVTH